MAIVIVNWRTARLVADCLRSIAAQHPQSLGVRVVVADNASGDDSLAVLGELVQAEGWEAWVRILPLERNGGFAYGNNGAIRLLMQEAAVSEWFWLLNPDTLLCPGALASLMAFCDRAGRIGIVGTALQGRAGERQCSAFRFHSPAGELEAYARIGLLSRLLALRKHALPPPHPEMAVDWVSGASMAVRREVFEAVGLLDESYFMYFEEVDLIRRARKAGFQCWTTPVSAVVHLEGQASGVRAGNRRRRPAYWFESRRRYWRAYATIPQRWMGVAAVVVGVFGWRIYRRVRGKPEVDPLHFLRDFLWSELFGFRGRKF